MLNIIKIRDEIKKNLSKTEHFDSLHKGAHFFSEMHIEHKKVAGLFDMEFYYHTYPFSIFTHYCEFVLKGDVSGICVDKHILATARMIQEAYLRNDEESIADMLVAAVLLYYRNSHYELYRDYYPYFEKILEEKGYSVWEKTAQFVFEFDNDSVKSLFLALNEPDEAKAAKHIIDAFKYMGDNTLCLFTLCNDGTIERVVNRSAKDNIQVTL